jgi:hypothetical protein
MFAARGITLHDFINSSGSGSTSSRISSSIGLFLLAMAKKDK